MSFSFHVSTGWQETWHKHQCHHHHQLPAWVKKWNLQPWTTPSLPFDMVNCHVLHVTWNFLLNSKCIHHHHHHHHCINYTVNIPFGSLPSQSHSPAVLVRHGFVLRASSVTVWLNAKASQSTCTNRGDPIFSHIQNKNKCSLIWLDWLIDLLDWLDMIGCFSILVHAFALLISLFTVSSPHKKHFEARPCVVLLGSVLPPNHDSWASREQSEWAT